VWSPGAWALCDLAALGDKSWPVRRGFRTKENPRRSSQMIWIGLRCFGCIF
jgi:hypothetical protein